MDILRVIFSLVVLLGICALLSWDRKNIQWRYVLVGLVLQFLLAAAVLGWDWGRRALDAISRGVTQLVEVSIVGASFVFGEGFREHFIAFSIPSAIIFISTLMALLYHFGIIQFVVRCMAAVVRWVMPVSGAESLAVCANVFIGNTESPLLIKPYIPKFTQSEIMTMMTGGMATISGGMLAVYVGLGADAGYMLTASLMAAPGAIVVSKILVPETGQPETMGANARSLPSTDINVFQALARGASDGLILAANVVAMLIAFVALVALFNVLLGFLPNFNGEPLTLQRIFGWIFTPFALLIGVDFKDGQAIGNLLGIKIFLTEFLAFNELKEMGDLVSDRSRAIATFALCSFSSFIAIGVQVGGIGALVPERKNDIARTGLLCMIGGTFVTMVNATIASLFF